MSLLPFVKLFQGHVSPGSPGQVHLTSEAYLHADASLELELQPDHVHFLHRAELVELRDFLGHLVNRHFNRIQFCARLADDLDSLLHVGEQVSRCTRAI